MLRETTAAADTGGRISNLTTWEGSEAAATTAVGSRGNKRGMAVCGGGEAAPATAGRVSTVTGKGGAARGRSGAEATTGIAFIRRRTSAAVGSKGAAAATVKGLRREKSSVVHECNRASAGMGTA